MMEGRDTLASSDGVAGRFLSHVAVVDKAAEVAKPRTPKMVELSDAAKTLPHHIICVTDPGKLNAQTPLFKCPPWAALPSLACHLQCMRDGLPLPALGLHRFPFYLFGRNAVCDYVLEHPSISGVHAVLVFHSGQKCFVLMDLGSTNGVKLNGNRIEKKKPIPAPVGSKIQFGFSSRVYFVRLGPPPSSKRLREEREKQEKGMGKGMDVGGAEMLACDGADAHAVEKDCLSDGRPDKKIETEGELGHTADQGMTNPAEDELDTFDEVGVETAVAAAAAEEHGSIVQRHLYHVLIKHKDVARPTSLAPRNKGERVTRSKADAIALAQAILARHQGDSTWSLEEFIDVVQNFSECGSAKRKGDLGMVESGTYTESFDAAAFSLKCGEVSKPVETELGVHLIYRVE